MPDGIRLYATARNVTEEQGRAEALLDRTAERDRLWQTSSPDLLVVLDFQGVLRRVNPSWISILRYAKAELVGVRLDSLVHPDELAVTLRAVETARNGPLTGFENRLRHRDGSYRWISWAAAPEQALIYATGRNVTADKERQSALETAETALRQSQKMDAIGQLTGGVAHDFNNVLTVIRSSIDVLKLPSLDPARRSRFLDAIADAVGRGAKLTGQLLAFAHGFMLLQKPYSVDDLASALDTAIGRPTGG